MGGDFFWDSEYVLKVLRANDVPEDNIPNFIKNYMDIEKRYLEGENILCEKHPRYVYKKRTVESEESMDVDNEDDNDNDNLEGKRKYANCEDIDSNDNTNTNTNTNSKEIKLDS